MIQTEIKKVEKSRKAITEALRKLQVTDPQERYDLEYSSAKELKKLTGIRARFKGTHYFFSSTVASEFTLSRTTNRTDRILDVGAGNGALVSALLKIGHIPDRLAGVDISRKACQRIRELGVQAFEGTLAQVPATEYDRIFLSYFIDRDANQLGTFSKAASLLAPGGIIELEGLFPCVLKDSNGVSYGEANVTKGQSAEDDKRLVIDEFARLGLDLCSRHELERYVYSMDGPEYLPSTVLIFRRSDSAENWDDDIPNFH